MGSQARGKAHGVLGGVRTWMEVANKERAYQGLLRCDGAAGAGEDGEGREYLVRLKGRRGQRGLTGGGERRGWRGQG